MTTPSRGIPPPAGGGGQGEGTSSGGRVRNVGALLRLIVGLGAVALAVVLGVALFQQSTAPPIEGMPGLRGDATRGEVAFLEFGCVSCHTIPGVQRATGRVGPPLDRWADRTHIAGRLPNTPDNLVAWIVSPQSIDPGNAMPDLGVPDVVAQDMAAYLYTLRGPAGPGEGR